MESGPNRMISVAASTVGRGFTAVSASIPWPHVGKSTDLGVFSIRNFGFSIDCVLGVDHAPLALLPSSL